MSGIQLRDAVAAAAATLGTNTTGLHDHVAIRAAIADARRALVELVAATSSIAETTGLNAADPSGVDASVTIRVGRIVVDEPRPAPAWVDPALLDGASAFIVIRPGLR